MVVFCGIVPNTSKLRTAARCRKGGPRHYIAIYRGATLRERTQNTYGHRRAGRCIVNPLTVALMPYANCAGIEIWLASPILRANPFQQHGQHSWHLASSSFRSRSIDRASETFIRNYQRGSARFSPPAYVAILPTIFASNPSLARCSSRVMGQNIFAVCRPG